jgi:hypothetical protein
MCAISEAKIRGKEVDIYMGYYGGDMSVGDTNYSVGLNKEGNRSDFIAGLSKYSSKELATLFADLVENAEEG